MDQFLRRFYRRLRAGVPGDVLLGDRHQITSRVVEQAFPHPWQECDHGLCDFGTTGRVPELEGLRFLSLARFRGRGVAAALANGARPVFPAGLVDVSQEGFSEDLRP